MNKEKICFKSDGTKETGAKIIKALEGLGGINKSNYHGDIRNHCYFIIEDADNVITYEYKIPQNYILKNIHTWNNTPSKDKPFYVVVTKENKEVLSKWIGVDLYVGQIVGLSNLLSINCDRSYNDTPTENFGNKITFEQFLDLYPECKEDVKPQFEVGQWYRCSCNENYYRFARIKDNKYFVNDAQINPTGEQSSDVLPGYVERLKENSLLDYFTDYIPVPLSEIQKFLPKETISEKGAPEYVIYIDTKYEGQIAKVINWGHETWCKVEFPDGTIEQPFKHLVKAYVFPEYEEPFKETPKEMSKEELLTYAREYYPVGTKFKCPHTNLERRVLKDDYSFCNEFRKVIRTLNGAACIYDEGYDRQWAEIVEEAKLTLVTEVDYTKLSKEEILEIAKEKYKDALEVRPFSSYGYLHTNNTPVERDVGIIDHGIDLGIGYIYLWNNPGVWAEITKYKPLALEGTKDGWLDLHEQQVREQMQREAGNVYLKYVHPADRYVTGIDYGYPLTEKECFKPLKVYNPDEEDIVLFPTFVKTKTLDLKVYKSEE